MAPSPSLVNPGINANNFSGGRGGLFSVPEAFCFWPAMNESRRVLLMKDRLYQIIKICCENIHFIHSFQNRSANHACSGGYETLSDIEQKIIPQGPLVQLHFITRPFDVCIAWYLSQTIWFEMF